MAERSKDTEDTKDHCGPDVHIHVDKIECSDWQKAGWFFGGMATSLLSVYLGRTIFKSGW